MDLTVLFIGIGVVVLLTFAFAYLFRVVVKPNEVHIVQYNKKSLVYGNPAIIGELKDNDSKIELNGNSYYNIPSWVPIIGVQRKILGTEVFSIKIDNYESYDIERLPFVLDLTGFFRIQDPITASRSIADLNDMINQLTNIIQGSARSLLSSRHLNDILQMRSELGTDFTNAVEDQLKSWGIVPVKNLEIMDIRDNKDSHIISDIMAKKKSVIERESRVEVATNKKEAEIAEIAAKKEADLARQDAEREVGTKTVESRRDVKLSDETAKQQIAEQARVTAEKDMQVVQVNEVRKAEIEKEVNIVQAEQAKKTAEIKAEANKNITIINSEANKQQEILVADGQKQKAFLDASANLELSLRQAEGLRAIGEAKALATKLAQEADVAGQITLAREIGENANYQTYLIKIEQVKANAQVGIAQAKALEGADLKVIVNDGNAAQGVGKLSNILNSSTGQDIGSLLEGVKQFDSGKNLVNGLIGKLTSKETDKRTEPDPSMNNRATAGLSGNTKPVAKPETK